MKRNVLPFIPQNITAQKVNGHEDKIRKET